MWYNYSINCHGVSNGKTVYFIGFDVDDHNDPSYYARH
ncbi:hypothetical protein BRC2024_QFGIOCBO_CDS_0126 [Acinetobacter phage vB_AbaM_PhT2-v2]